ncbi:recombination regulator RecX [Vibrio viridaestus]|uniref:Regulatory protein RecX n=1 Tax=Vibrio viridaestus TaxID=2487322 RepID=A0A3N9TFB4_9VIBR|nr:recombination regulator RecX [Vibrio viridaestus]RQW62928.1 recombination regulator RecX [Vibrio viridaestus]
MYFPQQKISCKDSALQHLSRRDHGEYELNQKLRLKGYTEKEVEEAISYCHNLGYIDDVRYAQSQIRQHISKGHGERRIRQELKQKRVSENDIELALGSIDVDWYELAKTSAVKKYRVMESVDQKEYAKRVRFLQYRGFDFDQIQYALTPEES